MKTHSYSFSQAINFQIEIETATVKNYLPKGIDPLEIRPDTSLVSFTAFNFNDDTPIGSFNEIIFSIMVKTYFSDFGLPKAGFFPINVAATTNAAKDHAVSNYHLPHYNKIDITFENGSNGILLSCYENGNLFLRFKQKNNHLTYEKKKEYYQLFTMHDKDIFRSDIIVSGDSYEHQDSSGVFECHDSLFFKDFQISKIHNKPFYENYYKSGKETMSEIFKS